MYEYEIVKKITFDSAHYLPKYDGKCRNLHGHTWTIEVGVKGSHLNEGILLDFTILKRVMKEICDDYDHKVLNDLEDFGDMAPTAEHIGKVIYERLTSLLDDVEISFVRVFETPDSCVTVKRIG